MEYVVHLLTLGAVLWLLIASLDLVAHDLGLLSLCHGMFFGIGAYSSAVLSGASARSGVLILLFAAVSGLVASTLVSLFHLRLRDDLLVLGTFVWQTVWFDAINNIARLGGSIGLSGVPRMTLLERRLTNTAFLALCVTVAFIVTLLLRRARAGRARLLLAAARNDEVLLSSYGARPTYVRSVVFIGAAAAAAVAGSLYTSHVMYIEPRTFGLDQSIALLAATMIGRATSIGPALGVVVWIALPELLRTWGATSFVTATWRQIVFGASLVFLARFIRTDLADGRTR